MTNDVHNSDASFVLPRASLSNRPALRADRVERSAFRKTIPDLRVSVTPWPIISVSSVVSVAA